MSAAKAEQVANVVLTVAAVGAAWYVMRTPRLRRQAWTLAVTGLTSGLPAWLGREVRHAWSETRPSGI